MIPGVARERLGKTISVRSLPGLVGSWVRSIAPYTEFEFVAYEDDITYPGDPLYKWVKLTDGNYANYIYPPAGLRLNIITEPSTDPPPAELKVESILITYADGTVQEFIPKV